tara:strand:- start:349 stop:618 length:270 start_codon:yes stop_codon:yes gene_type:complete
VIPPEKIFVVLTSGFALIFQKRDWWPLTGVRQRKESIVPEVCIKENKFVKYNLLDTKFHKSFFNLASNRYLLKHFFYNNKIGKNCVNES